MQEKTHLNVNKNLTKFSVFITVPPKASLLFTGPSAACFKSKINTSILLIVLPKCALPPGESR